MSHLSTPYDILGEMFKILPISCKTFTYPTNHTQASLTSAGPCIQHSTFIAFPTAQ